MLGHKLVEVLGDRFEVFAGVRSEQSPLVRTGIVAPDRIFPGVDALTFKSVEKTLLALRPEVVVNAIGVTKQKDGAKSPILSIEINSLFPHKLAEASAKIHARTISFSTDCVFNGRRGDYTEKDAADAEDLYGRSKVLGEIDGPGCLTVRSSFIGRQLVGTESLVEWLISNRGGKIKGFAKAIYSGLTTLEMARVTRDLIEHQPDLSGVYHVSGETINKFELLSLINLCLDLGVSIEREEDFKIDRSLDSARFRKATGYSPKTWKKMIEEMADDASRYPEWRAQRNQKEA